MSCNTTLAGAWVLPDICAYQLPIEVDQARSVVSVGASDFLALERGSNSVVYSWDSDGDGVADTRKVLASAPALNHGLAIQGDYLYASSGGFVYRWPLMNENENLASNSTTFVFDATTTVGESEVVIDNINADGNGGAPFGHTTRTLAFDEQGRLYVSVGSNDNIDPDSFRSRIRRFTITAGDEEVDIEFPLDFLQGEVFADGLRNEVGLAFDSHGDLWGVENSADRLFRSDIGGDIHADNPAEELNRFKEADIGKDWGYPKCWTEYNVPEPHGLGAGTIWAWPSFLSDGEASDEECRANTIPPVMSLQGHSAPLGITFYRWKDPKDQPAECPSNVAFPREMDGYAFIAYHGSWNRDVPTGYKVVYVEMDANGEPSGTGALDLLAHQPPNAQWDNGFRPVDVDFDDCGRLLVSSDGTRTSYRGSGIVRMEYAPGTFAPDASTLAPSSITTMATSQEGKYPVQPDQSSSVSRGEQSEGTEKDSAGTEASNTDTSSSSAATGSQLQPSPGFKVEAKWWNLAALVLACFYPH